MRRLGQHFAVKWLLVTGSIAARAEAGTDDDRRPGAASDRLPAIIASVRAEEAKYKDLEYVARIVVRDAARKDPADDTDVTTLATRRVVLQPDRNYVRYEAFERMRGVKLRWELISAYDGEKTRTVTSGNCANIHLGRFVHPEIVPAHELPLAHYKLNFPLSVYLSGSEAIRAYHNYPRDVLVSGSTEVFANVAPKFAGEEVVDGLRCLKVSVLRSYLPQSHPFTQELWLCPERNYQCVKERYVRADKRLWHEMHVAEMREVSPGVWFPRRIAVSHYDVQQRALAKPVIEKRTETNIDKAELAPHHDDAFFRGVAIPADLPVFTIEGHKLVGSEVVQASQTHQEPTKLLKIAAEVANQEKRYSDIEVKAHVRHRRAFPDLDQWCPSVEEVWEDRSVLHGDLRYESMNRSHATSNGWTRSVAHVSAFDGHWTRLMWGSDPQNPQGLAVILRKWQATGESAQTGGICVYRPHTLMMRSQGVACPLADLLASPLIDRRAGTKYQYSYYGTADVDGHPCIRLRSHCDNPPPNQATDVSDLYLATDRNDIPIKREFYFRDPSAQLIPDLVVRSDDFREIAPALWYPFRVAEFRLKAGVNMGQRWILLSWRRDTSIDSVTLSPRVDESLFRDVVVPAGAQVQVRDERGGNVGLFQQAETGPLSITPARYLELWSQAPVPAKELQARQFAIDALVGKTSPEFPVGAVWQNGKPMTWQDLRGRVVVLSFWAEWSGPCRDELPELTRLHHGSDRNDLTVIGVHPPGSELEAIKKVVDEFHLNYPTCIDVPAAPGANAWGELFGRFAVRAIPHAVVVDQQGVIVACGSLQTVLPKAIALVRKSQSKRSP
jgi:thiol-disulfide isomerase/thioredoxin